MITQLDAIDRKILTELQNDASQSLDDIARKVGASKTPAEHDATWQDKFLKTLLNRPEVMEAHRLAGDVDYILKVRVKNAKAYDEFYQALIGEVKIFNVTALLSMEQIKSTTQLPV